MGDGAEVVDAAGVTADGFEDAVRARDERLRRRRRRMLGVWVAVPVVAVTAAVAVVSSLVGMPDQRGQLTSQAFLYNALIVLAPPPAEGSRPGSTSSSAFSAVTVADLRRQRPEFDWRAGDVRSAGERSAISTDLCADGPSCQAAELAAWSSHPATCWYGVDALTAAAADAVGAPAPGRWYGSSPSSSSCTAGVAGHSTRPAGGWHRNEPGA